LTQSLFCVYNQEQVGEYFQLLLVNGDNVEYSYSGLCSMSQTQMIYDIILHLFKSYDNSLLFMVNSLLFIYIT